MYRPTSRRAFGAIALAGLLALSASACGSKSDTASGGDTTSSGSCPAPAHKDGDPTKAAWVYVGPTNDGGWTTAHDEGRKYVEEKLGDKVETTYKESIKEGPEATQTILDLVKDGNQIIFLTSYGFGTSGLEVAKKCPDIKFEHATGDKTAENLGTYYGASEDTIYLTGIAAGKAVQPGETIGFVAPFAIPEVIRHINAFALGAQSVNPTAKVKTVFTNTWFDPTKERQAADSLIDAGVKAIASGQDSPASGEAAKANNLPFVGYDSDQSKNLADVWLTASLYHWGPYYESRVKAVADGTWKTDQYYGGIKDGFVSLAPFGSKVDQATQDQIAAKEKELSDGSFYEFTGPLTDQDGKVRVADGTKMTLEEILTMDWFVQGVEGNPKG